MLKVTYTASSAFFDATETYRYVLERRWAAGPPALWIGFNPSKAGADEDDATIRKEVGFSKRWGMGSLIMVNLGALVCTNPKEIDRARWNGTPGSLPSVENDYYIRTRAEQVVGDDGIIVLAWGDLPKWALRRSFDVIDLLPRNCALHCIGLTRAGAPLHASRAPYTENPAGYLGASRLATGAP